MKKDSYHDANIKLIRALAYLKRNDLHSKNFRFDWLMRISKYIPSKKTEKPVNYYHSVSFNTKAISTVVTKHVLTAIATEHVVAMT